MKHSDSQLPLQLLFGPMLPLRHRLFRVLPALLLGWPAFAEGFAVDHWITRDGLPVNNVRGICQSPEGYIWLATWDGIARFAGVRFTVFNRSNTEGIGSNRHAFLYCEAQGGFWAIMENLGITHYSRGRFRTDTTKDGLDSITIQRVTGDDVILSFHPAFSTPAEPA